jgi:neopullulanase
MRLIYLLLYMLLTCTVANAQSITHLEPSSWWVGMQHDTVQVLVYGKDLKPFKVQSNYEGVTITNTSTVANSNYLFVSLYIAPIAKPGNVVLTFTNGNKKLQATFVLQARQANSAARKGFSSSDAIYLIVPDRFANGDSTNDAVKGMRELPKRSEPFGRHGGDIQGIINRLDYIKQMGFTQIWNTPLLQNDMPQSSYHGYAATNLYNIDARYGTNADMQRLSAEASKRGIGIIWDVVLNHIGLYHYLMQDPPDTTWVNLYTARTRSNHLKSTLYDAHATEHDKATYVQGWFDSSMPDLNQKNNLLATYLIQNSIWWIEYAGLSGIREDTYSYADKMFLNKWCKAILTEYPNFNIMGEEYNTNMAQVAYWQKGNINKDGFASELPTIMDFSLNDNITKALTNENTWQSSWQNVYQSIGQDYLLFDANKLLIFADNHDQDRIYRRLNNLAKWKLAMAILATTRGIPQVYYGTELLMTHTESGNDGLRRGDFYGGWPSDTKDAISKKGLTSNEAEAQQYFAKLFNWRKQCPAIHYGSTMQYAPELNDVYVYFRSYNNQIIMVLLNKNKQAVKLPLAKYKSNMGNATKGINVLTGEAINLVQNEILVPAEEALILEVQ